MMRSLQGKKHATRFLALEIKRLLLRVYNLVELSCDMKEQEGLMQANSTTFLLLSIWSLEV